MTSVWGSDMHKIVYEQYPTPHEQRWIERVSYAFYPKSLETSDSIFYEPHITTKSND